MAKKPLLPPQTSAEEALQASAAAPENPCVRNCCLNNDDVCLGCFRHLDEILAWQGLSPKEKSAVLKACEARRK